MIWQQTSIENIKAELILSCINNDPESFLPFLMSAEVETESPNKKDFYKFFKGMLNHTHKSSERELLLKIEQQTFGEDKEAVYYNFYDTAYKLPLLSIEVKENKKLIYLSIMPF